MQAGEEAMKSKGEAVLLTGANCLLLIAALFMDGDTVLRTAMGACATLSLLWTAAQFEPGNDEP